MINEETVADGSSTTNPYKKRWKAEREALKNFVANYGKLMQSKEDDKGGKLYKVFYDQTMSDLIGYRYCICVQWDEQTLKPKSTVYIRALDKFTPFIRRNIQYDTRGMDNMRGTADDLGNTTYYQQY
jgi:alpha-amylase/alpha-mannosidase (GH57 family)